MQHAVNDEDWREHALCAESDPEIFFPGKGKPAKQAKELCLRCQVRTPCLAWALANREMDGIYGALTVRERRVLLAESGQDLANACLQTTRLVG